MSRLFKTISIFLLTVLGVLPSIAQSGHVDNFFQQRVVELRDPVQACRDACRLVYITQPFRDPESERRWQTDIQVLKEYPETTEPELYAAQSIVGQIFDKGQYQQVIDLFDWSLQFEENLSEPCEPDDFLDTAYMPLAILCLRSHLRLGKTPAEVAAIFTKLRDADGYGLFSDLSYLGPIDEADLAPVKKILDKARR